MEEGGREEKEQELEENEKMRVSKHYPPPFPLPLLPFLTSISFSNELCLEEPRASSQYLQVAVIPPEKSRGSQDRDPALHTDRACCFHSSVELPLHVASCLHS